MIEVSPVYQVFRDGTQITTVPGSSFIDSGLQPQTTHSYAVVAFDAANNVSAPSSPASATTPTLDTTPPSVPANLTASNVTSSSATINWTASTDNVAVTDYQVFRNGVLAASIATGFVCGQRPCLQVRLTRTRWRHWMEAATSRRSPNRSA